ncbi:MAG TPA: Crp/Fnr family transcriptional regulator [Albitalea sp.]|nr:Crp/Fnr family transcriptional regulator [Albitalea sp.]
MKNQLLAALPAAAFDTLSMDLQLVPMLLGEMLYEAGAPLRHAYFPTTSVVSLHYVTASGASAETSAVGHEGMVGMPLFMGGGATPGSAVVTAGGHGYRLERRALMREFDRAGPLRSALLRYTQALITQLAQAAACYRHHSVEQQLSRWLLTAADRVPSGELVMTQELVAGLLGVRRESITQAASKLQELGYIRYRRGHISVLDHGGLQTCACECYAVVKKELGRLLQTAPDRPALHAVF